jgi:hypothetical protein
MNPKETPPPKIALKNSIAADKKAAAQQNLRQELDHWRRKYDKVIHQSALEEQIMDKVCERLVPFQVNFRKPKIVIKDGDCPIAQVSLWSDLHSGKHVSPSQTNNFGSYNFSTCCDRVKYYEQRLIKEITTKAKGVVDEAHICVMGDMQDGRLDHSVEVSNVTTVTDQWLSTSYLLAQAFTNIAAMVPKLTIRTVVGNHTRWQNQKKMPTDNRYSNLDQILYHTVHILMKNVRNVNFILNNEMEQYFTVKNTVMYMLHGDTVRGGDSQMGVPYQGIARKISTVTQMFEARNQKAPEIFLMGDKHRTVRLPTIKGQYIINGAFVGLDGYSYQWGNFKPEQTYFYVHPQFGKFGEDQCKLAFATQGIGEMYTIPNREEMV